jgi:hypothetical protein
MASGTRVRAAVGRTGAVLPPANGNAPAAAIRPSRTPSFAPLAPWLTGHVGAADAGLSPETDCLRGLLAADAIADAAQRAARIGVGADRVLIAAGAVDEETYLRRLADTLGVAFDTLAGTPRSQCPIDDERLVESAAAGMVPLTLNDELCLVVAPRGEPRRLLRDLGLPGFIGFQLVVGGNALAALVHPLFMGGLIYSLATGAPMWKGRGVAVAVLAGLYGTSVVIGYCASAFLGWFGLLRRGLLSTAWVLLLTPLHWLMLSLAAWRALYQLIAAPYA